MGLVIGRVQDGDYVLYCDGGEHRGPKPSMDANIDGEIDRTRLSPIDKVREKARLRTELDGLPAKPDRILNGNGGLL